MSDEQATQPLGELLRFGPGVPVPDGVDTSLIAGIWRGEPAVDEPVRRRPRLGRWLLPILILIAVIAILLWQRSGSPIAVSAVTVRATPTAVICGGTATVTAALITNGQSGTITYRWKRSDGTVSGALRQQVAKGTTEADVVLLWDFNGHGTLRATATLEVLSPGSATESAVFDYACN